MAIQKKLNNLRGDFSEKYLITMLKGQQKLKILNKPILDDEDIPQCMIDLKIMQLKLRRFTKAHKLFNQREVIKDGYKKC